MRKTILTILPIVFAFIAIAQEKPIAKAHYRFSHVNDTTVRDKPLHDEVVSYLGKDSYYYSSYSSTRIQEQLQKQMSDPAFDGNIVIKSAGSPINYGYVLNPRLQHIDKIITIAGDEFIVSEEFPVQDWEIHDETKEIGNYTCQKATCTFKGRNYTAWFTAELPIPYGPWKLHGLPGLILSAYDDKQEVSFLYDGFDKMTADNSITISPSEEATKSTLEEVQKLQKAFKDNPQAYISTRQTRKKKIGGSIVAVNSAGVSSSITDPSRIKSMSVQKNVDYKPSAVTNNPIELTP